MSGVRFNCAQCGQPIEAPAEAAGLRTPCPTCGSEVLVPATPTVATAPAASGAVACAFCQSPIAETDSQAACPACRAAYHAECWQENGGCAVYGCEQSPAVEPRRALEIPLSYWGQEKKPCPACGQEILAAAVRCRHCGVTFSSARPEDRDAFQQRTAREATLPAVRHKVVWLFIFCLLPCLAPFGAVWGLVWLPGHREEVNALPSLYPALCKIGIVVGIAQTLTMVIMGVLYALVRAG